MGDAANKLTVIARLDRLDRAIQYARWVFTGSPGRAGRWQAKCACRP